jgi:hypothetical protein
MAKPETEIKNYVLDAMRQLQIGKPSDGEEINFDFKGDIKVSVKLLGANRFRGAVAHCNHEELGNWFGYINGVFNVGKVYKK